MDRNIDLRLIEYLNDEWGPTLELVVDEEELEITASGERHWVPCDACHNQPCQVCHGVGKRFVFVKEDTRKVAI